MNTPVRICTQGLLLGLRAAWPPIPHTNIPVIRKIEKGRPVTCLMNMYSWKRILAFLVGLLKMVRGALLVKKVARQHAPTKVHDGHSPASSGLQGHVVKTYT